MSLLSSFLSGSFQGLSSSGQVLLFEKPNAELRLHATDAAGSGNTYPRVVLSNSYAADQSRSEIHFEGPNSSAADVITAKVQGVMSTYTAGAEVGALSMLARTSAGTYRGVTVWASSLSPDTDGLVSLGSASYGYDALHLFDTTASVRAYLEPGATTTLYFSGATFQLRSVNKTFNFSATETGVGVFHPAPPSNALLSVGDSTSTSYFSQSPSSSAYGVHVSLGIPSNVTTEANGLRVSVYSTSPTLTEATAIKVASVTKGGNATVTTAYGIYTVAPTAGTSAFDNISYYGLASNNGGWNVVADGGASWFHTMAIRDGAFNRNDSPQSICEIVSNQLPYQFVDILRVTQSGYSGYAGNMVRIQGSSNSGAYNLLTITDTVNTRLLVRGDGVIYVNRNTQLNGGMLSMTGRMSLAGQDEYNLNNNTWTADLHMQTAHGVTTNTAAASIYIAASVATNGNAANAYGVYSAITHTAGAADSFSAAVFGSSTSSYANTSRGGAFHAIAVPGHTGRLDGILISVQPQGTSNEAAAIRIEAVYSVDYGVLLGTGTIYAGSIDYGFHIERMTCNQSAFSWKQAAGGNPGDILRVLDSSDAERLVIDHYGNMRLGGYGRRIRGEFSSGTASNNVSFQSIQNGAATIVNAIPSSGGTISGFAVFDGSDPNNAARLLLAASTSGMLINSGVTGGGVQRALTIGLGAPTAIGLQINTNTDVQIGPGTLTTIATAGHLYVPSVGGTMTGVPTVRAGWIPVVVDSTGHRLGIYSGGLWKWTAALT